ncbi:MAG: NAD(P)-dependent oxidoreductase [Negativicutes bacterium]|nr:NAD(P)-dependent oxidoreductase [Negativicutes bacterium]
MRILLAGGAGDVGRQIAAHFCEWGHEVIILDLPEAVATLTPGDYLSVVQSDLSDPEVLTKAMEDCDTVVNLAWSFAEDPRELFSGDIVGHINLMDAVATAKVRRYIYLSSAVVYGIPGDQPVTEEQVCWPEQARKPMYGVAKYTAEKLCLAVCSQYGVPVTVLRFWWAFGETIGGKHLRQLIRGAMQGEPLRVADGAGGAFLRMEDLAAAIELVTVNPNAIGATYNLGSFFLTWQEIGAKIIEYAKSTAPLKIETAKPWDGPAFLGETWNISWDKATVEIGYRPQLDPAEARAAFDKALAQCVASVRGVSRGR